MIEVKILNFLSGVLECPAYMEEPENPPESFVIIQKTGGGMRNRIYSATFAIQSYAPTLYEAALLNEAVKEAMDELARLDSIASVSLNSDYMFMDTSKKRPRYQAVFDIVHY